jgi:hypothetical protein
LNFKIAPNVQAFINCQKNPDTPTLSRKTLDALQIVLRISIDEKAQRGLLPNDA